MSNLVRHRASFVHIANFRQEPRTKGKLDEIVQPLGGLRTAQWRSPRPDRQQVAGQLPNACYWPVMARTTNDVAVNLLRAPKALKRCT